MTICRSESARITGRARQWRLAGSGLGLLMSLCLWPVMATAAPDRELQGAVELLEKEEYARAVVLLHDLAAGLAEPSRVAGLLAYAYLGKGLQALSAGDFAGARKDFQEGRRYNGEDVRLWRGEAVAWYRQGRYTEAADMLDQALGLAPQSAELYHLLGMSRYAEGRMAEAFDALQRANELGGGEEVAALLEKVRGEWLLEQDMSREVRGHFQLSFVDGGQAAGIATGILETLEDAYAELGSLLDFYPEVTVPVLLYTHQDFALVTQSPAWAGAVYDGKIRLPLGGMHGMNDRLAALLYHEYVHVLVHFLANRNAPVWLNEGLAEVVARRLFSPPLEYFPKAVAAGRLISWEALARTFTALDEGQVPLAYEQSYVLVAFLVERFGWHKIAELLQRLGRGQQWPTAFDEVFSDYGLDWPALLEEWQASLGS